MEPLPETPDDKLASIRESAAEQVADGHTPLDEIAGNLAERFEIAADDALRPRLARLVSEALAAHQREQATWPAVTDCDRLDQAFARLEAAGVVSRQNFTCCQSCGCFEIRAEIAATRARGRVARGYAFFHQQDTARAVQGGGLYLAHGPVDPGGSPAASEAIGRLVVEALRQAGLQPDWDGSHTKRIALALRWQRRRTAIAG